MTIGFLEALVLGAVIVVLFGTGKLPQVFGELSRGLQMFRTELRRDEPAAPSPAAPPPPSSAEPANVPGTPAPGARS